MCGSWSNIKSYIFSKWQFSQLSTTQAKSVITGSHIFNATPLKPKLATRYKSSAKGNIASSVCGLVCRLKHISKILKPYGPNGTGKNITTTLK